MKGNRRINYWKIAIWIAGLTFIHLISYPCLIWMSMDSCTRKSGYCDDITVSIYRSVKDSTKEISIFRFISTEYFVYPYFNKKKFEFYTIQHKFAETVKKYKIDGKIIEYKENTFYKSFDKIPETIWFINNNEISWEEYKLYYKNEKLIQSPEPTMFEMVEYGPTLEHRFAICD